VATYAEKTRHLFLMLMEAIEESLGIIEGKDNIRRELEDGSQMMVFNFYPPCPQPDLTLGMPPHSDYGFLTLLLQDQVEGLQVHFQDQWLTVQPINNAFVVNVGDHLEVNIHVPSFIDYITDSFATLFHRPCVSWFKKNVLGFVC